jgi:hypothetical protein
VLHEGEWLISNNCYWGLTVQESDGNVVIYRLNPTANHLTIQHAVAATRQFKAEFNRNPSSLHLRSADGQLVQYIGNASNSDNAVAWATASAAQRYVLQDDGNFVGSSAGSNAQPTGNVWSRFGGGHANAGAQARPTVRGYFATNRFFAANGR